MNRVTEIEEHVRSGQSVEQRALGKADALDRVEILQIACRLLVEQTITSREAVLAHSQNEVVDLGAVSPGITTCGQKLQPDYVLFQSAQPEHPLQGHRKVSPTLAILRGKPASQENRHSEKAEISRDSTPNDGRGAVTVFFITSIVSTFFAEADTNSLSMPKTDSVSHGDLVVCACQGRDFTAADAIEGALVGGDLDLKWEHFLLRVAAEKRADEQDLELDDDAFDTAVEEFRYEHDLITAEETEQWLATRGLTLDDLSDYFARRYWGSAVTDNVEPEKVDYSSAPADLRDLFVIDLILSGQLEHLTTRLIWRLAALAEEKDVDPESVAAERKRFLERNGMDETQLKSWLDVLGRDDEWLDRQATMEMAYRARCEVLLVPAAHKKELVRLRLALTRFEVEVIEVESRDAAQEALFCVREDGMAMEEVASEGRYPFRRMEFLFEDLAPEAQQRFLSVTIGQVLEPVIRGDGFELCRIIKKVEPQTDDPAIRSRIEQRLLDRHFAELASKHVERKLGSAAATG